MVNLRQNLRVVLRKPPEEGIEALEERLGNILDNDPQLELLEQIFDLDQESLKIKYSNKICTWKLVHLRRNLRIV